MHPTHAHTSGTDSAHTRVDNRGFSLIELIVVIAIVGILMAILIPTFSGSKNATAQRDAVAAAVRYQDAIDQFMVDHGGMVPDPAVNADRDSYRESCSTDRATRYGNRAIGVQWMPDEVAGPINDSTCQAYLRGGPPESVRNGTVGFASATSLTQPPTGTGEERAQIRMMRVDLSGYILAVWVNDKGTWQRRCGLSNTELPRGIEPCV